MRAVTLCALGALLVAYASASPHFVAQFEAFKVTHKRRYASPAEEARRFKIFSENMRTAAELQAVNPHAQFGVNEFADVSKEEFKAYHNSGNAYKKAKRVKLPTMHFSAKERAAAAGQQQDWRPKGAVTAVKNQGQCGSCWSFSTTGGIEGQWFLAGNPLTSLSEQMLVSCDTIDSGCNGGLMDNAFTWLLQTKNGSIVTEASYPYVSGNGNVPTCDLSGKQFGAKIESYHNVQASDMAAFLFTNGPLSIAAYAEPWQTYTGGILTNCPNEQIDHGVLIVGFDDNNSPPYWIIKNSWGPAWGEEGYLRVDKSTQICSIGAYQTSSIVKKAGPTPAPGPTPPPGPTPAPAGGEFVQKTCTDARCSSCTEDVFPQGKCIVRSTASYMATCASNALIVQEFSSKDCSGAARTVAQPTDVCAVVFGAFDSQEFVQVSCRGSGPTPAPGPNPPPAPPAPTPAPSQATFTQMQCLDAACTQGCQSMSFQQNTCLQLSGGGSATAVCSPQALTMTVYSTSDCTGASQSSAQPVNQCTADSQGTYFENICGGNSTAVGLAKVAKAF